MYALNKDNCFYLSQAFNLLENARQRFPHVCLQHHVQRNIIEKVYNELQIPLPNNNKNQNNKMKYAEDDEDEVDEEVEGAYDDDDMI